MLINENALNKIDDLLEEAIDKHELRKNYEKKVADGQKQALVNMRRKKDRLKEGQRLVKKWAPDFIGMESLKNNNGVVRDRYNGSISDRHTYVNRDLIGTTHKELMQRSGRGPLHSKESLMMIGDRKRRRGGADSFN